MIYEPFEPSYYVVKVPGNTKAPSYNVYGDQDQVDAYCLLVNSGNWIYSSSKWFTDTPVNTPDDDLVYPDEYTDLADMAPENIRTCANLLELAELLGE